MKISIADWTDEDIRGFLEDLDNDKTANLSDWETQFLENNLDRAHFTDRQRKVVQSLVDKYGDN